MKNENFVFRSPLKAAQKNHDPALSVPVHNFPLELVEEEVLGIFLTKDHKPNCAEEKNRILKAGGSVEYLDR